MNTIQRKYLVNEKPLSWSIQEHCSRRINEGDEAGNGSMKNENIHDIHGFTV